MLCTMNEPAPLDAQAEQVPAAVGRRVRDRRAARGLTLDQLAERSGVSRRMIVNVEAGTSNASISTLLRLATALQVSLADLVADAPGDDRVSVTTATAQEPLWRGEAGGSAVLVCAAGTPDMLELWDWTLGPGERYESDAHRPGTRELLHVLGGHLTLTVGDEVHRLGRGDAASVIPDVPHSYGNEGRRPVRFTMTVLEPLARVRP
jgi:transcriptional regulator with XRE-family HTH domain